MAPAMQPSQTEYDKPWLEDQRKSKDYLRDSGKINVNFSGGFDEDKELNSSNTFIDAHG